MCSKTNTLGVKLLKFCWIRDDLKDYEGIDLLWFNFIKSSKRYISPERASKIKTPFSTLRVWVFWKPIFLENWWVKWDLITKWDLVDIILTARQTRMNAIQIYWICDFAYLKLYKFLVISSISLSQAFYLQEKGVVEENIDFFIIDGANPGSWKWYDYEKINNLKLNKKFLVAGWVNENNVKEIFKIFEKNPYFAGVDIASWVDNGKNIDEEKVKRIYNLIN